MKKLSKKIAYFSMEFAFSNKIPNYAGGLGVLAADAMHSIADLNANVVGVSLLYHQDDDPKKAFNPDKIMKKRKEKIIVIIEDREVKVAIWQMDIKSQDGKNSVPVFFLSTNLPENPRWDRDLTKNLYASDEYTRIGQEVILGIGGVRALRTMGYDVDIYHMNEGHSAFLTLENLRKNHYDENAVKNICTFTTHTPVGAGHDYFNYNLVYKTINKMVPVNIKNLATEKMLGMTQLALNLSKKTNSVSEKHREVCKKMFPDYEFENVTNGIYHPRWIGEHIKKLFDKNLKGWEKNTNLFKQISKKIPDKELVSARKNEKKEFVQWINENKEFFPFEPTKEDLFNEDTLTLVFARRFVPYKRPDLIFKKIDQLRKIGYKKLQLVFSGRCHPADHFCNNLKAMIGEHARNLRGQIKVAILPDYNLDIAKRLVKGADVWLNNPVCPQEASGTSGMKAGLNGLLNLSILDGWWIEGFKMKPKSGWGFGQNSEDYHLKDRDEEDAKELLKNLEDVIDCYYNRKSEWTKRMKEAISLLSFFNTNRMIEEYYEKIWNK